MDFFNWGGPLQLPQDISLNWRSIELTIIQTIQIPMKYLTFMFDKWQFLSEMFVRPYHHCTAGKTKINRRKKTLKRMLQYFFLLTTNESYLSFISGASVVTMDRSRPERRPCYFVHCLRVTGNCRLGTWSWYHTWWLLGLGLELPQAIFVLTLFATGLKIHVKSWGVFATTPF